MMKNGSFFTKNTQFWRVFENKKLVVKQYYQTGHFQKFNKNAQTWLIWRVYENRKLAVKQC